MRNDQTKAFLARFAEVFTDGQVEYPISKEGFSIDVLGIGKPRRKVGIIDKWMRNRNIFEYKSPSDKTLNTSKLANYVLAEASVNNLWIGEIDEEISGTLIVAELSNSQKKKLEKDKAIQIYPGIYQTDLCLFKIYLINIDEIPHTSEWADLLLGGNEQAIMDLIHLIFKERMHELLSITFVLFNDEVMKVSHELGMVVDKTSISIRKAVEYLGFKNVIEELGFDRVIEEFGLKRVIDEVGLKRVIDEVGIERVLLELDVDEIANYLISGRKKGKISDKEYKEIVGKLLKLGKLLEDNIK